MDNAAVDWIRARWLSERDHPGANTRWTALLRAPMQWEKGEGTNHIRKKNEKNQTRLIEIDGGVNLIGNCQINSLGIIAPSNRPPLYSLASNSFIWKWQYWIWWGRREFLHGQTIVLPIWKCQVQESILPHFDVKRLCKANPRHMGHEWLSLTP